MHNFKELKVWQEARTLVKAVYQLSKAFPDDERFGLTNQVRRSAISIPSNIAEGSGRKTQKDFCHFLYVSQGSSIELEIQLILAMDLEYINEETFSEIESALTTVQKMLNGLINSIENKISK
jgi:four helix bundle protein